MRRWPWITMSFAALLALCPIVQDIAVAAYRQSPTDWLRELWLTVTVAGVVILALLALLERWIRSAGRRYGGVTSHIIAAVTASIASGRQ